MNLDFTVLTDDQLLQLVKLCCQEAVSRSGSTGAAMHQILLDEAEKARITRDASETEIRAIRAQERERIAKEAIDKTRAEEAARTQEERIRRALEKAELAKQVELKRQQFDKSWLQRFSEVVELPPSKISVNIADTRYGTRVLVNEGFNRFCKEHLVDFTISNHKIKTKRNLIKNKPDLIALCVEFSSIKDPGTFISGNDHHWG